MLRMQTLQIFLTVVLVVRNQSSRLRGLLSEATRALDRSVADYELVVIDNASDDDSVVELKKLTDVDGLPNVQVFALTKEVDGDTAFCIGLENALGDYVASLDPMSDDVAFLPTMIDRAMAGADVVFAANEQRPRMTWSYQVAAGIFNALYKWFNGIHLAREAPQYRVLSRRVVNFISQHAQPSIAYRHLPATGGFARVNLNYSAPPEVVRPKNLFDSVDRGMRLLVSTTRGPMRLVTALAAFGAISNLLYSGYVVAIALFKADIAHGWVTLSLQQSGMFFLISLVLLVLGEYILNMASLSNEGPRYHIGQEFMSARILRNERLNIEDSNSMKTSSAMTRTKSRGE